MLSRTASAAHDESMPISSSSIALVFLGLTALLVLLPRRLVRGDTLSLFRCMFPAWRFFEEITPAPRLRYRVGSDAAQLGPWIEALHAPPRTAAVLLCDPAGNQFLACQSLVERLASELEDCGAADARELLTYRLVQRLVRRQILAAGSREAQTVYQFQLDSPDFESALHVWDE
jgi:hypothetical protein